VLAARASRPARDGPRLGNPNAVAKIKEKAARRARSTSDQNLICKRLLFARRAHHQADDGVLDFVNPEFSATSFLSALRFLVTVLSDLSCCGSVLKAFFSKFLRWP
jgi:hypothetical protein